MEAIEKALVAIDIENLLEIRLTNPWTGAIKEEKITIRRISLKGDEKYQIESFRGPQAFHQNIEKTELRAHMVSLGKNYRSWYVKLKTKNLHYRISKKKKVLVQEEKAQNQADFAHDREKNYILKEGMPIDFLIYLGIMNEKGQVFKDRRDKFKQLNSYLVFIDTVLKHFPADKPLKIVDFGCGKSYLTFSLYYYLKEKGYEQLQLIGLDLKEEVIRKCNQMARDLRLDDLTFLKGDIRNYQDENIDMVISLHACDTATDYAIYQSILWRAKVLMMVPCCQHEVAGQLPQEAFGLMLKHGILKEKFAALLTDAIRAEIIRCAGYEVDVMEFIDMAHTPKNILIRGILTKPQKDFVPSEALNRLLSDYGVNPTLFSLMKEVQLLKNL